MLRTAALWTLLVSAACLLPLAAPYQEPAEGQGLAEGEGPVVRVAQGLLRGRRIQRPSDASISTLYAFQGVPYAKPPVGHRRFKDPEEPENWSGVRNATSFGARCIQKNIVTGIVTGEEDCLFLNIYTADPPSSWQTQRRPVTVFIHGGGYVQWTGDMVTSTPDPLLHRGVVFVSFNYRLAVMGFLNTEDCQAPGNAAFKDQVMALRWVRNNIAAFGGDPSMVTIMGESAGGGSVQFHLLSPLSIGLFRAAISVSGSTLTRSALEPQPRRNAVALRRRWAAACPDLPEDDIVGCLQRLNASELVFHQYDFPRPEFQNFFRNNSFRPSVEAAQVGDKRFLPASPMQMLADGRFARVPYMAGFNTGEGILYLAYLRFREPSRWAVLDAHFEEIFRWELPLGLHSRDAARRVRQFYFGNRSIADGHENMDTLNRFVQMSSDVFTTVGTVQAARLLAERWGAVYVYQFSRDGPIGFIKQGMNASWVPGVMHGDDMAYVFDRVDRQGRLRPVPASEQPLRQRQADIFANVIKSGNPTPADSGLLHWPAFTPRKESYMDMDVQLSARDHALGERIAFWRSLLADARSPAATNGVRHPGGRKA